MGYLLRLEWAIYGKRIRVVAVLGVIFLAMVGFETDKALLPDHVQTTILKYQEKSNGVREFFGTGVREVASQRDAR